jgi:hypothetical protein
MLCQTTPGLQADYVVPTNRRICQVRISEYRSGAFSKTSRYELPIPQCRQPVCVARSPLRSNLRIAQRVINESPVAGVTLVLLPTAVSQRAVLAAAGIPLRNGDRTAHRSTCRQAKPGLAPSPVQQRSATRISVTPDRTAAPSKINDHLRDTCDHGLLLRGTASRWFRSGSQIKRGAMTCSIKALFHSTFNDKCAVAPGRAVA